MDVHVERTINRPSAEVFEFFSDSSNNPSWQKGMKSCTWTSDGPIGVGSTYDQEAEFMGRPVRSTFEVTGFESGRKIAIATVKSSFPIQVTRTVDDLGDGRSRVHAHISGGPGGVMKLLGPLTNMMARRSIEADYDRLVEHLS